MSKPQVSTQPRYSLSSPVPERMDKLFVIVSINRQGDEGIIYLDIEGRVQPLITSDEELLNKMYPLAVARALETGDPVKILLFQKVGETDVGGEDLEEPPQEIS